MLSHQAMANDVNLTRILNKQALATWPVADMLNCLNA